MGKVVTIGNAVPVYAEQEGDSYWWKVEKAEHPDAPVFAYDGTGAENQRCPSSTAWGNFIRAVGLEADLRNGMRPITEAMHRRVFDALADFRTAYPEVVPGFRETEFPTENHILSANLARLEWVAWWVGWARANCKHPAIDVG